ncbi:MAG: hypothetical protein O2794_01540 [bacterium]|nr:hypothetical protein [bacterium]
MYIAHVYPLTTALPQKYLEAISYFTKDNVPVGSLVEITFNKKKIPALVIQTESIGAQKASIKKSSFTLKKIHKILVKQSLFPESLLLVLDEMSQLYLEPPGSILKALTPISLFEGNSITFSPPKSLRDPFQDQRRDITVGSLKDRVEYYEAVIREVLAKKKIIVIFAPTVATVNFLGSVYDHLPRKPIIIHSKITKKAFREALERIHSSDGPQLVIGTPMLLGCMRGIEHTIIIEDSDSPHYTRTERPRIRAVAAIRIFAHNIQARLIEGKHLLSLRDIKHESKAFPASSQPKQHETPKIISLVPGIWSVVSTVTLDTLRKHNERFIMLVTRKGFYSFVLCLDCGAVANCDNCGNPLAFHTKFARRYSCHNCGKTYNPHRSCAKCNGWNLKGYGVGTESIKEALELSFPQRKFWTLDADSAKTKKTHDKIVQEFIESDNGVLVGTEMILEDPRIEAEHVLVAHIDNLFSIPDIGIHEKILSILIRAQEKSFNHSLFIQTRFPDHPLFQALKKNDLREFLKEELKERKDLNFPPYTLLIKCTVQQKDAVGRTEKVKMAENILTPFVFSIASYPSYTNKNEHIILLTTTPEKWIREGGELRNALLELAGSWTIVVDPTSIL